MTALPPKADLTGGTITEGQFKTAMNDLRDFLSTAIGADSANVTFNSGFTVTNGTILHQGGNFDMRDAGDVVLGNDASFFYRNSTDDDSIRMLNVDTNDIVQFGDIDNKANDVRFLQGGVPVVWIPNNRSLGIGRRPDQNFDVYNPDTSSFCTMAVANADGAEVRIAARSGGNASIIAQSGDALLLGSGGNEAARFTTNGNFFLGTTLGNGLFNLGLPTERVEITDAGSTGSTEQDWIEVNVGGVTGYIRVYGSK
jgi:hypothetical protein